MQLLRSIYFIAAGALLIALANPASAQTTGGLSGQVIDAQTQNPVPDAVVIATSPALQGEQTAVTDGSGTFEITLLPAGTYTINVQREAYQPFTQSGLTVRLDRTIKIRLQLVPEAVQAGAVEITVAKPTISTSSAATGSTVSKEQMNLVPYGRATRNFEAVATSVPGVQTDGYGLTMNGSSSPETAYIIDGVMVNDPAYGLQGTTLLQDFVQEVDIKTGGYQAEYGRATGGIVNVVTKSGGNDFHGSVFVNWTPFEAARAQIANAGLAIGTQSALKYNLDFGFELGGPILKDKLWFFAGFAPQIQSLNQDRIIQARIDDGSGRAKIDPATGFAQVNEVTRQTYAYTSTAYQFTGKLTYLITENHSVALAAYGNPTKSTGAQVVGTLNEGAMLADTTTGSTDLSLRYSGKLFNKSMLVEVSAGYHAQTGAQGGSPSYSLTDIQGISAAKLKNTPFVGWRSTYNLLNPQFDDGMIPASQKSAAVLAACAVQANGFDPCPVLNYGTGGFGYIGEVKLSRMAAGLKLSNFVELAGHHQFKYGIDGSSDTYDQTKQYTGGSSWRAGPTNVAGPPTQFQLFRGYGKIDPSKPGTPLFDTTSEPGVLHNVGEVLAKKSVNSSVAFYVQDTWNIMDKLVLDIGVRGEKQVMKGDAATPTAETNKLDLFNIMPRIGLIYDWTGRGLSKVYASFGRFYEYIPLDMGDRALSAETSVIYITNANNCGDPRDPRTCAVIPGAAGAGKTYAFNASGITLVDPNLKGQYTDEYQAGAQYQVYRDISFGVDYVRKQIGRVIEDMSTDDGTTYFISNPSVQGGFGYSTTTGTGQTVLWPEPKRVYDGLTFSVNKAFSDNYLLSASYTWSSFRGNYPGLISPGYGSTAGQLDPNILAEYDLVSLLANKDGPLKGESPNAAKLDAAYVYEVNPTLTLNLGGNFNLRQGGPMDYLGAHPVYGTGLAYILPRGSAGRLPWQWAVNLRAAAAYKLYKDYTLGLNVDLFNVTNNKAATAVDENYTTDSVYPIVNGNLADLPYLKNTAGAPVTKNVRYGSPVQFQLPFSARLGARISF